MGERLNNIDRFIGEIQRARPGDTIIVHTANDPDSETLKELLNVLAKIGYEHCVRVLLWDIPDKKIEVSPDYLFYNKDD